MHYSDTHDIHDATWIATQECQAPFDEAAGAIAAASPFAGSYGKAGGLLAYGIHLTGEAYCDPTPHTTPSAYLVGKDGYDPSVQTAPEFASATPAASVAATTTDLPDPSTHCLMDVSHTNAGGQIAAFDFPAADVDHTVGGFDWFGATSHTACAYSPASPEHASGGFDYSAGSSHGSCDYSPANSGHSSGGFDYSGGGSHGSSDVGGGSSSGGGASDSGSGSSGSGGSSSSSGVGL